MRNPPFLSLLNAALTTDLIVILLLLFGVYTSSTLKLWYKKFGLGAVIADVLILVIGFLLAFYIYPFVFGKKEINLFYFIMLAVFIQVVHDLLFAYAISLFNKEKSPIIDVFKLYIRENKAKILLADASMVVSTILLEKFLFTNLNKTSNLIALIALVYATPYIVFSV